jgi:hypothetical protein
VTVYIRIHCTSRGCKRIVPAGGFETELIPAEPSVCV